MGASSYLSKIVQVLTLVVVLLFWSSLGIFPSLTHLTPTDNFSVLIEPKSKAFKIWFADYDAPSAIHLGETYRVSFRYAAKFTSKRSYIHVDMSLKTVCSGGKDLGRELKVKQWKVNSKYGQFLVDYDFTEEDMPLSTESLCYLQLTYDYAPYNEPYMIPSTVKVVSTVFKLSRAHRTRPLPTITPKSTWKEKELAMRLRRSATDSRFIKSPQLYFFPMLLSYSSGLLFTSVKDDPEVVPSQSTWTLFLIKFIVLSSILLIVHKKRTFFLNLVYQFLVWLDKDISMAFHHASMRKPKAASELV
jgi:hypothetical protein